MTYTFQILLLGVLSVIALPLRAAEPATDPQPLPNTKPLLLTGDISVQMHEAAHRDMERAIADSPKTRAHVWRRDATSTEAYERSILPNRQRFQEIIGLRDSRLPVSMERYGDENNPAQVGDTKLFSVYQVRWPVLEGVHGEGLLLEPKGKVQGLVVALPDADQTPEQLVGLAQGVPVESQFARRLAENGFVVIVPVLLDRSDEGSGNPRVVMTNQPHREWIHRPAYMMGRHVIGYEVQKVLAVVDWFAKRQADNPSLADAKIGIAGYGEGGLLAFYAAAVDPRIRAVLVSGYFKSRQQTWQEPLYRNVFGLLREFGDAEIATLIAPRGMVVEFSLEPKVDGPPPVRDGRKKCAAPGKLSTPPFAEVNAEFNRIGSLLPEGFQPRQLVSAEGGTSIATGSQPALTAFVQMLGVTSTMSLSDVPPHDQRRSFNTVDRQLRQVRELDDAVQWLVRDSDQLRNQSFLYKVVPEFKNVPWNYHLRFPVKSSDDFVKKAKEYRNAFWDEIIGRLDAPLPPLNPRSRKIYDEPTWTGYEVVLDTGAEGFAWGILCLPKNLKPGEKRPVVVCQHGRNGVPSHSVKDDVPAYQNFAARLAERGFITLAPHNLYRNEETYRSLSRKGNTVKASMFSVILRHHEQWLSWLATQPNVDAKRIGFYGLSYGGETAIRVPPLLEGYALSICSGDFNDWTRKVASTRDPRSFMFTDEWEMPYFNMGGTFSYAELSYLNFPRPFMVERGHHDVVAVDSWVASEYAKTRWFYTQFGLPDKTDIEFFNGGHVINGEGTFEFLHKHLNWPKK
ncbi:MAG: putative dienelactone hydrolase [Planctomycetaceae bacterium]|nr:putative dienelactone hydrolase [Planctomycetaceae bacterium]